jgi:hypothetical protein
VFGQVLEKLDAWFGRSFLLASYFPWLIFAAANVGMAWLITPAAAREAASLFTGSVIGAAGAALTCLAVVAAIAYVTDPLIGRMTGFLEGTYFPRRVTEWLTTQQSQLARALEKREAAAKRERAAMRPHRRGLRGKIDAALSRGVEIGAIIDTDLIAAARTKIAGLTRLESRQRPIPAKDLESAIEALVEALERNSADPSSLKILNDAAAEPKQCAELNGLYRTARRLIRYAHQKSLGGDTGALDEKLREMPEDAVSATRFGNEAAAFRGRFERLLAFDFEFFWPIFQAALLKSDDDKSSQPIANARQHLEFCTRIFWLTAAFTAIWLVLAAMAARSVLAVPLIGTIGLLAAALWLNIAYASYRSFADVAFSLVMLRRFDVLKALHIPLPATWEEEKKTWDALESQLRWSSDVAISYVHPDK